MGLYGALAGGLEGPDARSGQPDRCRQGLPPHLSLPITVSRTRPPRPASSLQRQRAELSHHDHNEENPYTTSPETVYRWGRSRCLGGRSLHFARASDRMADYEFKAASRDGYGMDWPLSYSDLAPYYDRVESFIGVS